MSAEFGVTSGHSLYSPTDSGKIPSTWSSLKRWSKPMPLTVPV